MQIIRPLVKVTILFQILLCYFLPFNTMVIALGANYNKPGKYHNLLSTLKKQNISQRYSSLTERSFNKNTMLSSMKNGRSGGFSDDRPSLSSQLLKNINRRSVFKIAGGLSSLFFAGELNSRLDTLTSLKRNIKEDILDPLRKSIVESNPTYENTLQDITIVFHGAGGPDMYTEQLMKNLSRNAYCTSSSSHCVMIDWSKYSKDTQRASFNGQYIGQKIARFLMTRECCDDDENKNTNKNNNGDSSFFLKGLKRIHIIGISVGAFASDSMVNEISKLNQEREKQKEEKKIYTQLTLLDPFCLRPPVNFFYGERNFGLKADYAQQYMNTVSLSSCA